MRQLFTSAARRRLYIIALVCISVSPAAAQQKPQRIVSTNLCTDQMLIRLVEPERIQSITYLSYRDGATPPELQPVIKRIRQNHGLAEEVLRMKPDLVLSGEYTARFSNELLGKLGYPMHFIKTHNSFDDWYKDVLEIGDKVGEPERARKLVADFKRDLAALQADIPPGEKPIFASLQVNYNYPGKGTLTSQLVNAGGFRSVGDALGFSGYRTVPLEQLIRLPVELVTTNSSYEKRPSVAALNLRHPLLRRMASKAYAAINIPDRYTVCTTPETLKMVATLVEARKEIDAAKAAQHARPTVASR